MDHSIDLSIPDFLKVYIKKKWTEATKNFKILNKCMTANTSAHGSMQHIPPTNLLLLAAKQEPYKKAYHLKKHIEEFSEKKSSREWTSRQKRKIQKQRKTDKNRQKNKRGDSKVESNDSPEIPGKGETSDIPGLPSEGEQSG